MSESGHSLAHFALRAKPVLVNCSTMRLLTDKIQSPPRYHEFQGITVSYCNPLFFAQDWYRVLFKKPFCVAFNGFGTQKWYTTLPKASKESTVRSHNQATSSKVTAGRHLFSKALSTTLDTSFLQVSRNVSQLTKFTSASAPATLRKPNATPDICERTWRISS